MSEADAESSGGTARGAREWAELWSALLLAAATVATAFSAYEATRWSGVQATKFTEASAERTESAKASSEGFSLVTIDADLFTQYAVAFTEGNHHLMRILQRRFFRNEFKPAFREWSAEHPLTNPKAVATPFQLPSYRPRRLQQSNELTAQASARFEEGRRANQNSDDYVLATIFFAAVLFFAGLSPKFSVDRIALGALGFGTLVFLAGVARILTLPFH
ncbi:MAG: hypothetical protein WB771_13010 [Solirubrobacterales bacterium]